MIELSRFLLAPRIVALASSVSSRSATALLAQQSRVIGNATRVVTGTTARAIVNPPSADRRAATVLRLPILVKPLAPTGSGTSPGPTTPPTPGPAPAPATPAPPPPVFEPRFAIDHYGLLWVPAKRAFHGTVRISIVDTLHPHKVPQTLPTRRSCSV